MKNRGFTLIEMAIVSVVIGLISASAMALFKSSQQLQKKMTTDAVLIRLSNELVNFAINNHRLPCPDTSSDGYENCATGVTTGGVPFNTLLFELGTSIANSDSEELNMIYGVYKHTTSSADLTVLAERTGDTLGMEDYQNQNDFVQALRNAVAYTTSAAYPYLTGNDAQSGAEDCTSNVVVNPAFVIASAGGEDRSGNGNNFDGVNENLSQDGTGGNCFAAIGRREDANYDDGMIAVDFNSLLSHVIN
ncbi:MAG: type II secretion system protein [Piscirickettsiaceae bacterium]|nr:type II secretion system protein [Piscirickettsiaceae bacterium]